MKVFNPLLFLLLISINALWGQSFSSAQEQYNIATYNDALIDRQAKLVSTADSSIYAITLFNGRNHIFKIKKDTTSTINFDCTSSCFFDDLALDTNNNLIVASKFKGVFRLIEGDIETLVEQNVEEIVVTPTGDIYGATSKNSDFSRIIVFTNNEWQIFDENTPGISSIIIYDIAVDTKGNAWFASNEGLIKYDGEQFNSYETEALSATFYDIAIDADDHVWVASAFGGLGKFDGSSWTTFPEQFSTFQRIHGVTADAKGSVWTSTGDEILHFFNGTFNSITHEALGLPTNYDISDQIVTDKENRLWIIGNRGDFSIISFDAPETVSVSNTVIEEVALFELSPNPNNGSFMLDLHFTKSLDVYVKVLDISGKVHYNKLLPNSLSETLSLDINYLPNGIYYLVLQAEHGVSQKMFTVAK